MSDRLVDRINEKDYLALKEDIMSIVKKKFQNRIDEAKKSVLTKLNAKMKKAAECCEETEDEVDPKTGEKIENEKQTDKAGSAEYKKEKAEKGGMDLEEEFEKENDEEEDKKNPKHEEGESDEEEEKERETGKEDEDDVTDDDEDKEEEKGEEDSEDEKEEKEIDKKDISKKPANFKDFLKMKLNKKNPEIKE